MYKIYFDNRVVAISNQIEDFDIENGQVLECKNKKTFENAYNLFRNDSSQLKLNVASKNHDEIFKYLKRKFKAVKAAGGIVTNPKGELLVIKRHGFWDLPKGKIEKGERKKMAAIREVEEECGISGLEIVSKFGKTYHTYNLYGPESIKTTHWYVMKYKGNNILTPQTEESITEVKWVGKEEIDLIVENTFESLKPLFLSLE